MGAISGELCSSFRWKKITAEQLDLDYAIVLTKEEADRALHRLEQEITYFEKDLARVKVFGKWFSIPRKQASYGDSGLSYKFSGVIIPALEWTPTLLRLKNDVELATGYQYNFVLVNRYKDGLDYMSEHRDNEAELDRGTPIASLSLGATRDFTFRHSDARRRKRVVPNVKLTLASGSLLLMNPPTNQFWYHALPKRASSHGVRVNLTFRKINRVL